MSTGFDSLLYNPLRLSQAIRRDLTIFHNHCYHSDAKNDNLKTHTQHEQKKTPQTVKDPPDERAGLAIFPQTMRGV